MDPSQYCVETFEPHLKTIFTAEKEPRITIPLQLVEVVAGASHPRVRQFSLLFRGPAEPRLAQHIFRLQHAVLGDMDLFLVPVGSEAEGATYQAVFNRFVDASPQK